MGSGRPARRASAGGARTAGSPRRCAPVIGRSPRGKQAWCELNAKRTWLYLLRDPASASPKRQDNDLPAAARGRGVSPRAAPTEAAPVGAALTTRPLRGGGSPGALSPRPSPARRPLSPRRVGPSAAGMGRPRAVTSRTVAACHTAPSTPGPRGPAGPSGGSREALSVTHVKAKVSSFRRGPLFRGKVSDRLTAWAGGQSEDGLLHPVSFRGRSPSK